MKLNGIIFDFNGTMFQDSHLHEQAWIDMIQEYNPGNPLTEEEILTNLHGRTNDKILRHFVSPSLTDEEIQKLSLEKEEYYRTLCLAKPEQLVLTDGLIESLDTLKEMAMPLTIATATIKENVDFYFETFALDRWFDPDKVVFDDGSFPGKPEPDIFLHAAKKIAVAPENCLVIEDAYSGLCAANRANIGMIIAIDPFFKNRETFLKDNLCKNGVITDFNGFTDYIFAQQA
jgi:beta-phosphoglucomutase